jgi:glycosyltransferase involved in cell wall biosynthesis
VESVLAQKGVDVRVLILDDASPDNTPALATQLVQEDSRLEYRRHELNKGHIDTYNEGLLEWVSGKYCLLLSADDLLAPGALQRAVCVLDSHPEIGLVHGRQEAFQTNPTALANVPPAGDGNVVIVPGESFIENCCAHAHNPVATPTAVVRSTLQRAVGGYRKSLPHTADTEMWLRFAARASVARVEALQAFKRRHVGNMQHGYIGGALGDLKERRAAFEYFFDEDGVRLADSRRLRIMAMHALGENAFWAASRAFEIGDEVGYKECLNYAVLWWPQLVNGSQFARLRWKRRLGHRLWGLIRPFLDSMRCQGAGLSA